jgi:hypothetical protein
MVEQEIALHIKERALRDQCSEEDFQMIKRGVGLSIGRIATELLEPVYRQHPEIDDMRDEG